LSNIRVFSTWHIHHSLYAGHHFSTTLRDNLKQWIQQQKAEKCEEKILTLKDHEKDTSHGNWIEKIGCYFVHPQMKTVIWPGSSFLPLHQCSKWITNATSYSFKTYWAVVFANTETANNESQLYASKHHNSMPP
jgi:hypothetical protein